MTQYLLDSHILVWLVQNSPHLGNDVRCRLETTTAPVYVSYFSLFELAIKSQTRRFSFDMSIIDDLPAMGLELLMPDIATLRQYRVVNPANTDPFDNMLLAVARQHNLTFVTADRYILDSDSAVAKLDART